MGWGNCGTDSRGRPIGYNHEATCDHEECNTKIDRGLSYACGDMHGEDEISCEKYFCEDHLPFVVENSIGRYVSVCNDCGMELLESGDWSMDDEDGVIKMTECA